MDLWKVLPKENSLDKFFYLCLFVFRCNLTKLYPKQMKTKIFKPIWLKDTGNKCIELFMNHTAVSKYIFSIFFHIFSGVRLLH